MDIIWLLEISASRGEQFLSVEKIYERAVSSERGKSLYVRIMFSGNWKIRRQGEIFITVGN